MTLTELRTAVADAISAGGGIRAQSYVSESLVGPVAVVVPADEYVTAGPDADVVFGHVKAHLDVLVIGNRGTSKSEADRLDAMLEDVFARLDPWTVTAISRPDQVTLNGVTFLGAVVSVDHVMKLGS